MHDMKARGGREVQCHSFLKSALDQNMCGPDSSVGIATGYGLAGPVIESRWGRDFSQLSRSVLGRTHGYRFLPGGKVRPGREADLSPLLVPWSKKSRAIPLLPLWAVQPVQSLSACARVHFNFLLDHSK